MLNKNITLVNFKKKISFYKKKKILNYLHKLTEEKNEVLSSMRATYKDSYDRNILKKFKKINEINIIGMGGSALGAKAIFKFLKIKKKKFNFIDDISNKPLKIEKNKNLNLVISKSGNTLETISNSNILINNSKKNIFITENKKSYLMKLAKKLKSEVVHHNNFIGGRFSVLSEVGMLPAQFMGLNPKKFRQYNDLFKSKKFINQLVNSVINILNFYNEKKTNSIILNYDYYSNDLFKWYQQLVAESLGKKNKGILPVISSMPRDNHSIMQYYLDGIKNHFFTFFFVKESMTSKINSKTVLNENYFLKDKKLNEISYVQFLATQNVFKKKKIPFRSFVIEQRNEKVLGELFTFFILETILLGMALGINPYNQPAVELIKKETKKILI